VIVSRLLPEGGSSPTSWYAVAIAALIEGSTPLATRAAEAMREGGDAFGRAADAIAAIAVHDGEAARRAIAAIEEDFAARDAHLTGIAIADTAVLFATLLERSAPLA